MIPGRTMSRSIASVRRDDAARPCHDLDFPGGLEGDHRRTGRAPRAPGRRSRRPVPIAGIRRTPPRASYQASTGAVWSRYALSRRPTAAGSSSARFSMARRRSSRARISSSVTRRRRGRGPSAVPLRQQPLHPLGLRNGAHHAVEDDALGGLRLGQLLADDAEDDVVARPGAPASITALALSPSGVPRFTASRSRSPVANFGRPSALGQQRALGALAGAGRAQEEDVHRVTSHCRGERKQ